MPGKYRRQCIIHYADKNKGPDNKWRNIKGISLCVGIGPGPRNVLVDTQHGKVVVPYGNVRRF